MKGIKYYEFLGRRIFSIGWEGYVEQPSGNKYKRPDVHVKKFTWYWPHGINKEVFSILLGVRKVGNVDCEIPRSSIPYTPDPKKLEIKYAYNTHPEMVRAAAVAMEESLDSKIKTGATIVGKFGDFLASGANGSWFHKVFGCPRKLFKMKTGAGYWMCLGCQPKNHAEQTAIRKANKLGHNMNGASLYLWGHWWCCKSCCDAMIAAGIKTVYLEKQND
jgi:deoxycytidylate deaminase